MSGGAIAAMLEFSLCSVMQVRGRFMVGTSLRCAAVPSGAAKTNMRCLGGIWPNMTVFLGACTEISKVV